MGKLSHWKIKLKIKNRNRLFLGFKTQLYERFLFLNASLVVHINKENLKIFMTLNLNILMVYLHFLDGDGF